MNITTTEAATELDLNTEENQSTTLSNFGANIQMDQCCACPGPTTTLSILSDNQQSKFHIFLTKTQCLKIIFKKSHLHYDVLIFPPKP